MAKVKDVEAVIARPNVHLAVKGKLQRFDVGQKVIVPEDSRLLANGSVKLATDDAATETGQDADTAKKAELEEQIAALKEEAKGEKDKDAKAAINDSIKELEGQLKALS